MYLGLALGFVLSLLLIFVINKQSFGWTVQFAVPYDFLVGSIVLGFVNVDIVGNNSCSFCGANCCTAGGTRGIGGRLLIRNRCFIDFTFECTTYGVCARIQTSTSGICFFRFRTTMYLTMNSKTEWWYYTRSSGEQG